MRNPQLPGDILDGDPFLAHARCMSPTRLSVLTSRDDEHASNGQYVTDVTDAQFSPRMCGRRVAAAIRPDARYAGIGVRLLRIR